MTDHTSSHQKLYLSLAFTFGVLLTLGFKDFYPDLERRFRRRDAPLHEAPTHTRRVALDTDQVSLEDHTDSDDASDLPAANSHEDIVDGIEGCIGNTPLIRLKGLSEATGCEILAKAEVRVFAHCID